MLDDTKTDALKRLNYITGHLEGVRKMVESDAYCVAVLKHRYCVRSLRTFSINASAICGMFSKLPADCGDTT